MHTAADLSLSAAEVEQAVADRLAQLMPSGPPSRAPGARRRLVIVTGQQGSGKSTVMRMIVRALGSERVVRYEFDDHVTVLPRYDEVMRAHGVGGYLTLRDVRPPEIDTRAQSSSWRSCVRMTWSQDFRSE